MYHTLSYLKFLLKSTNQHGVHSPFVYDFVTKCLYDRTKYPEYEKLKHYRNHLFQSKELPKTKHANTSFKFTKLVFRISKYFQLNNTLELGTSLGVNTQALAVGHSDNSITTIEDCQETFQFTRQQFEILKLSNITAINSDIEITTLNLKQEKFDCIFINNFQNKEATLKSFKALLPKTHNDSIFIFKTIYHSKKMTEIWQQIIQNNRVTVSIDTFNLGFVFFRKEQPKQHFTIRL